MIAGWIGVPDGHPVAAALHSRHYSRRHYTDGRRRTIFIGPGEKLALVLADGSALFIWRKFVDMCLGLCVQCAAFRNESALPACDLIREAELIALRRWPATETFWTYVNPRKVRGTPPGNCFYRAGWQRDGTTTRGLHVLRRDITVVMRSAATLMKDMYADD